jgi:hypothetical protein
MRDGWGHPFCCGWIRRTADPFGDDNQKGNDRNKSRGKSKDNSKSNSKNNSNSNSKYGGSSLRSE